MLSRGARAPEFALDRAGGGTVSLADYRGKKAVVVYFYPRDFTPGCTVESCEFRDSYEDFVAAGAEVVGISEDSVASHDRFGSEYRLPFVLASDHDGKTAKAYGVTKALFGIVPGRVTFVIDKEGVVRDAFSSHVRVKAHVSRALELVREIEARR